MSRQAERKQPGLDVTLGGESYIIVPQRQARLTRRLFGPEGVFNSFEELGSDLQSESSFDNIYALIGGRVYDVLAVFIPGFMPRWQFDGFGSPAAAEAKAYEEEADRSPTVPEIEEAIKAAIQVNGLTWLSKIKDFVDPTVIKNQVTLTVARMGTAAREAAQLSPPSPSSPPPSGPSAPTPSGTSAPTTPTPTTSGSPSPGSPNSPTPTSDAATVS